VKEKELRCRHCNVILPNEKGNRNIVVFIYNFCSMLCYRDYVGEDN
jgi:hypothetical protein